MNKKYDFDVDGYLNDFMKECCGVERANHCVVPIAALAKKLETVEEKLDCIEAKAKPNFTLKSMFKRSKTEWLIARNTPTRKRVTKSGRMVYIER